MNRKKLSVFLIAIGLGLITAGAAFAQNSLKSGARALSFSVTDQDIKISGRHFTSDDVAILAGFGFALTDNGDDTTDFSLSGGIRKYLGQADLAPFIGGEISYDRVERVVVTGTGTSTVVSVKKDKTVEVNGHFGAEYFFAEHVSAEAQVGIRLSDTSNGTDSTTFGTFRSGITVNIYLP